MTNAPTQPRWYFIAAISGGEGKVGRGKDSSEAQQPQLGGAESADTGQVKKPKKQKQKCCFPERRLRARSVRLSHVLLLPPALVGSPHISNHHPPKKNATVHAAKTTGPKCTE